MLPVPNPVFLHTRYPDKYNLQLPADLLILGRSCQSVSDLDPLFTKLSELSLWSRVGKLEFWSKFIPILLPNIDVLHW